MAGEALDYCVIENSTDDEMSSKPYVDQFHCLLLSINRNVTFRALLCLTHPAFYETE